MSDEIWYDVRDSRGRLLFRYNPETNVIDIKPKQQDIHSVVRLDEIRAKFGIYTSRTPTAVMREDQNPYRSNGS